MKNVINRLYTALTTFIVTGSSKSIIGFSRSILAAGVLLKLVFNDTNLLITPHQLQTLHLSSLSYRCNFFLIFNSSHLFEMQILAIIILALVISGYYVKITSLLHLWITLSLFMFRQVYISVDRIDLLLTLLLVPVCLFDERKNHWHHPVIINKFNNVIQNIFLFLIKNR